MKAYALKVSAERRAGKFKRVGKEFLDGVEAELSAAIRGIGYGSPEIAPDPDADWVINGRTLRTAEERLNDLTLVIVAKKVMRHPSIGKTLK